MLKYIFEFSWFSIRSRGSLRLGSQMSRMRQGTRHVQLNPLYLITFYVHIKALVIQLWWLSGLRH